MRHLANVFVFYSKLLLKLLKNHANNVFSVYYSGFSSYPLRIPSSLHQRL